MCVCVCIRDPARQCVHGVAHCEECFTFTAGKCVEVHSPRASCRAEPRPEFHSDFFTKSSERTFVAVLFCATSEISPGLEKILIVGTAIATGKIADFSRLISRILLATRVSSSSYQCWLEILYTEKRHSTIKKSDYSVYLSSFE